MSTNGGYATGGGKSLSWTMGETFHATLSSVDNKLTQGFEQPYVLLKLIHLKAYIEGFYRGGGLMEPVLYNAGLNPNSFACDSITVELHDARSPYNFITSARGLLKTDGTADILFPSTVINSSYYISIHHRNSLETWSKNPLPFTFAEASFDFTSAE